MISDDILKNNTVSLGIKRPGYQSGVFNSKQLTYHLILKQILTKSTYAYFHIFIDLLCDQSNVLKYKYNHAVI